MGSLVEFEQNAGRRGLLVDTNLLVLFVVGTVNPDRVENFKRTSGYSREDWTLLAGVMGQAREHVGLAQVFAEVNTQIDLKYEEGREARRLLGRLTAVINEVEIRSRDACAEECYERLGLTDAAIVAVAKSTGCSVLTNDRGLHTALTAEKVPAAHFDDLRRWL